MTKLENYAQLAEIIAALADLVANSNQQDAVPLSMDGCEQDVRED